MPNLEDILADTKTYPDETSVKLADGTEATLGQLRKGYMKDSDYRKKTSDLARAREEFERDAQSRAAALADAETRLQGLARQIAQNNPQLTRDEVADELEASPAAKRLMGKITDLEGVIKPLAQAVIELDARNKQNALGYIQEQHRRVLAKLKESDPDLNPEDLVRFARDNFIPRLDHAYKVMNQEKLVEKTKKSAEEEAERRGYEKAKRELVAPTAIPLRRVPARTPDAPKTLDEAVDKALADPEVMGPISGWSR